MDRKNALSEASENEIFNKGYNQGFKEGHQEGVEDIIDDINHLLDAYKGNLTKF